MSRPGGAVSAVCQAFSTEAKETSARWQRVTFITHDSRDPSVNWLMGHVQLTYYTPAPNRRGHNKFIKVLTLTAKKRDQRDYKK